MHSHARRILVIGNDCGQVNALAGKLSASDAGYIIQDVMVDPDVRAVEDASREVDAVAIANDFRHKSAVLDLSVGSRKKVFVVPGSAELLLYCARPQQFDDLLVFEVDEPGLSAAEALLKRCADVLLSAVTLALAAPLVLAIWTAIRLGSPGPIIYRQERIGKQGRPFWLLKFRTMYQGAENLTGPVLATDGDVRITPIGRFLRSTHLDELPQLLNVLRGEMSLVGPRPERPCFTRQFERTVRNYALRYSVRPGITGLAQIMAGYNTSAQYKLSFDLMYIYNYSPLSDFKILLQTTAKLLRWDSGSKTAGASVAKPVLAAYTKLSGDSRRADCAD